MIPTRIEIHNFGAIPDADIDLSSISLAAVVGHNGAGKSTAFTIAPTWALFGSTKNGCPVDSLVRMGTDDARVSLEFEHRGDNYRVTRTRSNKGRGKSSLELQKMGPMGWESLSGATIKETEEKIRDLVGLDEETFVSSSMILQGRADEFTSQTPGQRKQILSQILGLSIYENLQAGAKAKVSARESEVKEVRSRIERIDESLQGRSELEHQRTSIEMEIEAESYVIAEAKDVLDGKEKALTLAVQQAASLADYTRKASDLRARRDKLEQKQRSLGEESEKIRLGLAEEAEIERNMNELEKARKEIMALLPAEDRRSTLVGEFRTASQKVERLEKDLIELNRKESVLSSDISECSEAASKSGGLLKLRTDLEELKAKEKELQVIEPERSRIENEITYRTMVVENERKTLEADIRRGDQEASKLENAGCVNLPEAKINPCAFLRGAMETVAKLPEMRAKLEALGDPKIAELIAQKAELEEKVKAVGYNAQEAYRLTVEISALEPLAAKAAEFGPKSEMLEMVRSRTSTVMEELEAAKEMLEKIKAEGKDLSEKVESLRQIREQAEALSPWEEKAKELPLLKQKAEWTRESMESTGKEISSVVDELTAVINTLESMPVGDDLEKIKAEVSHWKGELLRLQKGQETRLVRLGGVKSRLEDMESLLDEKRGLEAEIRPLATDLARWKSLVEAFGRDGIPALVIENAIPELERISNEILGAMSNGRHALRFETQRELKSKAGMAETLDIIVMDWQGARPYETFSGGEQLRIDFAIRFALAELLARRAGNRVEWLVVDEGLGSQDREHRGLVLEAIRNVANRFKRVLVITHVEEAQGAFPQQIRFERSDECLDVEVA